MIDLHELKESLTIDDVENYMTALGGEPIRKGEALICKTICHCGEKHRLYYYFNTQLFRCYTDCPEETFDIFELTTKIRKRDNNSFTLTDAINEVARFFGIDTNRQFTDTPIKIKIPDWEVFKRYQKATTATTPRTQGVLKEYPSGVLEHLPRPHIIPWLNEGISQESLDLHNICYDPKNCGIVIPHYDIDNRLIGIRERTLIKENEKDGKYMPAVIDNQMYNHPLGLALYNLNWSKNNIKNIRKAICFESEKSCLKYDSMYAPELNITVACCGSNFTRYQFLLLQNLGVQEIIIAFDKQFQQIGDSEHQRWAKKLRNIYNKYGAYVKISYMFDKEEVIGYKESPIDRSKEEFEYLYNRRVTI